MTQGTYFPRAKAEDEEEEEEEHNLSGFQQTGGEEEEEEGKDEEEEKVSLLQFLNKLSFSFLGLLLLPYIYSYESIPTVVVSASYIAS